MKNLIFILNYNYWYEQYSYLGCYILFSFVLSSFLFILSFIFFPRDITFEKNSTYECGFEPFGSAQLVFNIQFFIVGILFMVFDLELAYIFPWVLYLGNICFFSFFIMFVFLFLLIICLLYEWKKGALDWI